MPSNHSSIYMRGLFDGLREGMSPEMTPKKHKMALDSMSAICQKIFAYVPIADAMTANQIVTAMRHTSTRPDLKTATGCLNSLKDAGLVVEPERGLFRQVVPREILAPTVIEAVRAEAPLMQTNEHTLALKHGPQTITLPAAAPAPRPDYVCTPALAREATPASVFGEMAAGLRLKGQALINLADHIDDTALAFEQQIEDANTRLERFNQLKALLAS